MALSSVARVLHPPMSSVAASITQDRRIPAGARACRTPKLLIIRKGEPDLRAKRFGTTSDSAVSSWAGVQCRASSRGGGDERKEERVQGEASQDYSRVAGAGAERAREATKPGDKFWSRTRTCARRLWRAILPGDFFSRASLDDVLQHYEEKLTPPLVKWSPPKYKIFGREKLLQEFLDLLNANMALGFNAPRKLYQIAAITGGSGSGKSAMLGFAQRHFDKVANAREPAQDVLGRLLQQGAYVVYNINFRGGHNFSARDAPLTTEQRVGVRLFACLLGVSLSTLRDEYGLPEEVETRLTVEAVVALGARRQRLKAGLDPKATVLSIVFMDELNSALYCVKQYVQLALWGFRASWPAPLHKDPILTRTDSPAPPVVSPPSRAPSTDPDSLRSNDPLPLTPDENSLPTLDPNRSEVNAPEAPSHIESYAENLLKEMVEATAAAFTVEGTAAQSKAGSSGVIGLLVVAGKGLPLFNLYPSSWAVTELVVTNLGQHSAACIVEDRVNFGGLRRDEALMRAFQAVFRSCEFCGLIQFFGGTPQSMVWLARTFEEEDVKKQLSELLTGQVSVPMLCSVLVNKVYKLLYAWGTYPLVTHRGMAELGGWRGMLELVTLTVTGVPVGPGYIIGGQVTLSRAECTGVVFTKPFVREPAQSEEDPRKEAAARAEGEQRLRTLLQLTSPLWESTLSSAFATGSTSLRVLDIPPAIQYIMLDTINGEAPEDFEDLITELLMSSTKHLSGLVRRRPY